MATDAPMDDDTNSSVQVAVRVRPLSATECAQACGSCVQVHGGQTVLLGGSSGKQFDFDAVFPPHVEQFVVYEQLLLPLMDRFFDGYNATVFAYGQTGSGKTYTMGNEVKLSVEREQRGIIPRVMEAIFERIAQQSDKDFVVKVSYLEILNEEIHDLLAGQAATTTGSGGLSVRDDGKRGIVVTGLSEHPVDSIDRVASLLQSGAMHRATASTNMNAHSSRSHAICTLTMEQYDKQGADGMEARFSKFHLVDLAGSERAKRTNAEGARFKEGVNINKSLLSLGNVINALSERCRTNSTAIHVPYRDSKLTRLLQDSLGGNSKTLMIACISPADVNFEESSNTLRYAARARNIQNRAIINKEVSAANEVSFLKQQLELMQLQLLQQTKAGTGAVTSTAMSCATEAMYEREIQKWKEIARSREEELKIMLNAKEKWKKVADELVIKVKAKTAGPAASTPISSASKELVQEALEFEKSVPTLQALEKASAEVDDPAQLQSEFDHLTHTIRVKENIVAALAAQSGDPTEHQLATLTSTYETKIVELEKEVDTLTTEKKKLALEAAHKGKHAIDGDRLSRLHEQLKDLHAQLKAAKQAEKECKRLTQQLKSGTLKISTLEKEVTDMKKQKATLQRKLKEESEAHRKEKRQQDLQILQLKRQEQRKQYELQKLTNLHNKQNNVLKRKNEEIAAANKKMRTMQQKQQSVREMKQSHNKRQTAPQSKLEVKESDGEESIDDTIKLLTQNLEVQTTIAGAKKAIQMDLDERKIMALEIAELELSNDPATQSKLAKLKEALREKNADIRLLQQKLASVERNNALPTDVFPSKTSACHLLIKHLVESVVDAKSQCMELEHTKSDLDAAQQQLMAQAEQHEAQLAELNRQLSLVRGQGHAAEGTLEKVSGPSDARKIMELEEALATAQKQMEALQSSSTGKKKATPKARRESVEVVEVSSSEEDDLVKHADIRLLQEKLASVERNNALLKEIFPSKRSACHLLIKHLVESVVDAKSQRLGSEQTKSAFDTKKITELEEALASAQKQIETLQSSSTAKKKAAPKKKRRQSVEVVELSSSEEEDPVESDDDSDYVEEVDDEGEKVTKPVHRRKSTAAKPKRQPLAAVSSPNPRLGNAGGGLMDEIDELLEKNVVAGTACCSCNGKCATKACACKAFRQTCGVDCSCNATKCQNRGGDSAVRKRTHKKKSSSESLLSDDKENEVESFFVDDVSTVKPTTTTHASSSNKKLWGQSNHCSTASASSNPSFLSHHSSARPNNFGSSSSSGVGRFF
ncbi:TPA: hypothetical protein N0F65_006978 [Lagenidium giganteum]|uniref:Kinesin motor domain-containing protein n=1 Tax=Lagenidium giganteum TaxID=4803 RepID=A0AAV2ZBZ8_9STRA|nr:TPA: hypothetical protein N0F65_006978 [Lagenidium giganteum]